MATLTKDGGVKTVSNKGNVKILLANGWTLKEEVKEVKKKKSTEVKDTL